MNEATIGNVPLEVNNVSTTVVTERVGQIVWDRSTDCLINIKSENVKLEVRADKEVK